MTADSNTGDSDPRRDTRLWVRRAWWIVVTLAIASRVWNALTMTILRGFDAVGHISYVLFLDLYHAIPHAHQGWSFFHPPLHYLFGWLLAQSGSGEVLVRGLALIASAGSLLAAAMAARIVRMGIPGRPELAPLAFVAVAFIPVHAYSSTMPGNELTSVFFASATILLFLRNELSERPTLGGDAMTGLAAALALWTKFNGLVPLAVVAGVVGLRALRAPGRDLGRAVVRIGVIVGVAGVLCSPYYVRNIAEYGTPFQLHRDFEPGASFEAAQAPGHRTWRDLVSFPVRAFVEPEPEADPLLSSIPGSVYVNAWTDARPGVERPLARTLVIAGIVPTVLAFLGFGVCLVRAFRSQDVVDLTISVLGVGCAAMLAIMAYRVPTFAMLKASYLLGGSVVYGYCIALGVAVVPRVVGRLAVAWVLGAAVISASVYAPGLLRPMGTENVRMAALHSYFGATERAEAIIRATPPKKLPDRVALRQEQLAVVLVEGGDAREARKLYRRRVRRRATPPHLEEITSPWVRNRYAVASALAGRTRAALALIDDAIAGKDSEPVDAEFHAPLFVNRGLLRATLGDLAGAEQDLRTALDAEPDLAAGWFGLAWLATKRGESAEAARYRAGARLRARKAPSGFVYGVGDGFSGNKRRFMLVVEAGELALYRPARARNRPSSQPAR